ncbi:hypothetical protein AO1008_07437 [Aspergillus oryzae 100-8]|nr:hypothetical protein AO1008_07437 [Aspergillus oryzae 100-8]
MDNLGKELIQLCDRVEQFGLVDYQMGIWEEEILGVLGQCLDLYESLPEVLRAHMSTAIAGARSLTLGDTCMLRSFVGLFDVASSSLSLPLLAESGCMRFLRFTLYVWIYPAHPFLILIPSRSPPSNNNSCHRI